MEIPQLQFLARLFTCPLLFHRQVLVVSTVQNTVEDPVEFQQVPMVLTVQRPAEVPQVHFLDEVVDMLVCCATTGAHGLDCDEDLSGSGVASSTNSSTSLSFAEADPEGPDVSKTMLIPQLQYIHKVVDVLVVVPQAQVVEKTIGIPMLAR